MYEKMNMLASQRSWDELATAARKEYAANIFAANYYHLAQAYRGRLCEELFKTVQHGPQGILYVPQDHAAANPCLAHVLFATGNMAAAQNVAFNSMFTPEGYDYAMMKIVAQVDIMRGSDEVASKYIDILKKQKDYKEWAENAYDDPDIERGRRDFPEEEAFVLDSPMGDIFRNPVAVNGESPASADVMGRLLEELLKQIVDTEVPFIRTSDSQKCKYCDYCSLCGVKKEN